MDNPARRKRYIKDKFGKVKQVIKSKINKLKTINERYRMGNTYMNQSKDYGRHNRSFRSNIQFKTDVYN